MARSKNSDGNFITKQPWYFRRKNLTAGGAVVLLLAAGIGLFLFQTGRNQEDVLDIPEAAASEIPGWWLDEYFGASVCESDVCRPEADPDSDRLTNRQEFFYSTDPWDPDTNDNDSTDGEDVAHGFNPVQPGKIAFDQALSDDSIFGESLLFSEDIKNLINKETDPNRVTLPRVLDAELNISPDDSVQAVATYLEAVNDIVVRYFGDDFEAYIELALLDPGPTKASEIEIIALQAVAELKRMTVPLPALQLHKYYISMIGLLPDVLSVPDSATLQDETNTTGNYWYDQAQAFSVLIYRIQLEGHRLNNLTI